MWVWSVLACKHHHQLCVAAATAGEVSTAQIMVLNELRVLSVWVALSIGLLSGKHVHIFNNAPFFPSHVNVKHSLHRKK